MLIGQVRKKSLSGKDWSRTNSVEQHRSVEANGRRAIQEIPTFNGIRKFITVSPTWDHILGLINPFHTHTYCCILTSLLILQSYLCLPGLFLRGSKENMRIYLEGPRKMRKPSGVRAGRLAAMHVWDLAEDECKVPTTKPQSSAAL